MGILGSPYLDPRQEKDMNTGIEMMPTATGSGFPRMDIMTQGCVYRPCLVLETAEDFLLSMSKLIILLIPVRYRIIPFLDNYLCLLNRMVVCKPKSLLSSMSMRIDLVDESVRVHR